ncbi:reverse transcriptase domain-containing protein [Tanacetum coccineum]
MFNSTLIGAARVWFDELPSESIDGYKDLKATFLSYFMQQKKYAKDPIEIHNIKQKDGDTIEEFMKHFKTETGRMKGAPECMRISGFMHGVNNPELMKRPNERVPKIMEEMMTTTAAFIRGETAAASKKKVHAPWKSQDQSKRHALDRKLDSKVQTTNARGHSIGEAEQDHKVTQSFDRIREIVFPPLTANEGAEGPLVIEAEIGGHMIHRMYVDGDATHSTEAWMNFMILRSPSPYNGIIGRPGIKEIQAVPSTTYGMIKFPVKDGVVTIRSTIFSPMKCATVTVTPNNIDELYDSEVTITIHPDFPDQEISIGGTLSAKGRTELCALLKRDLDIFAWQPSDMTGVPRSIEEHKLNIRKGYLPVR